ncbi:DUF533 domain-containing protein [Microvirga alba]|uniref:DUF533 domain-containing protein n=1 Tax=Microvirga alba TaxID=2791025 RepID=A0A931BPJ1_9HYPH|nr:DUF533 domain-containing protein [Microvirga alba]MBF9233304.1 DUF533 domain-containing protein [Microvirga alba]
MFDAKKLLDALGTPAGGAGQATTPAAAPAPSDDAGKKASANPLGAGTLLSDLIGIANQPTPPASSGTSEDGATSKPAKASPPPPKDLTDLLIGKAQEYLKTPQGNAAVNAVVVGLTKAVANSETGRKLTASAKAKGTALFNRFVNKGAPGTPLIDGHAAGSSPPAALPPPAPVSAEAADDTALLVLRAMIAAAAADGRIDEGERERILGTLKQAGIDGEGVHAIEAELAHPATAAELAAAVKTPEAAVQVYTAARRIITPNTVEERVFLAHLSGALGIDPRIVAQIDAAASGAIKA